VAAGAISWWVLPKAIVVVVLAFYVLPYVVIPAAAKWMKRRGWS
jgi:hypothetical protein